MKELRKLNIDDYKIMKTETGFRVSLIKDENVHTHLKTLSGAKSAISYVVNKKIPKRTGLYFLMSLARLSVDNDYIDKVNELINVRLQKGRKQRYYNPKKKK